MNNIHAAKSEDLAQYIVTVEQDDDATIRQALAILTRRVNTAKTIFGAPTDIKNYLTLHNATQSDQFVERFGVLFLDAQNGLVNHETLFTGTLTQTSVYPREVVRAALRHNAASVVLTHNHPSGSVTPSRADEVLTQTLRTALALVDCRILDHIIVGEGGQSLSMAEKGLI
jgi:DNA repair protein RadC